MVTANQAATAVNMPGSAMQPSSAEESTKMMGTLMHVQELFYNNSTHKDGNRAGKVNKEQLKESKSYELIVNLAANMTVVF